MADRNSLMIDLDDERAEKIAEVITNKSCKKILSLLVEREMNASEIADGLKIPLNTVGYNLDKLISAGLIEKAEKSFWSVKGKKVHSYRISNKKIVISPRTKLRGVLPAVVVIALGAIGIKVWEIGQKAKMSEILRDNSNSLLSQTPIAGESGAKVMSSAAEASSNVSDMANTIITPPFADVSLAGNYWIWFMAGAIVALGIFILWNWRPLDKK